MNKNQFSVLLKLMNSATRFVGRRMLRAAFNYVQLWQCPGNCQHFIVALGLIIWFLMVPPLVNAPWKIDVQAPLRQWAAVRTFETEQECDRVMSAAHAGYRAHATATIGSIKRGTRAFALQMVFSQCVSEDNPDLGPAEVERPSS